MRKKHLFDRPELSEGLGHSLVRRLPWLAFLMVFGLLISGIISLFEEVIRELSIIVCFQSMILGMAGNTGTQSLTVTVRLLSQTPLSAKGKWRLIFREVRIGLTEGILLGTVSALAAGLYAYAEVPSLAFAASVGGCVGMALCATMTLSSFTGTIIPMAFDRLGLDPAVTSGPLITTLGDLVSVVLYYGLAWLLLTNM